MRGWIALGLALVSGVAAAQTPPPAPVRAEVPVREVVLSNGEHRYAVPIKVGGTPIEAGLDSGSVGLRILPNVLADGDAQATRRRDTYAYGAGAKLDGVVADATVAVGDLQGRATVQLVDRVGCSFEKPRCAAKSVTLAKYGIQGDGLPGEGFKAILGVNMARADVDSLFRSIGARRWIIELPRPGEARPGRIVLNPTDAEVEGYVRLPVLDAFSDRRGGAHDAVAGCLAKETNRQRICGAVILDTGAPGLRVAGRDIDGPPWPNETPAQLVFADASGKVQAAERLVIGRRAQASHLSFEPRPQARVTIIYAGLAPYFAYSVLYDPEHGTIGLKPRPPAANGPEAIAVP